MIQYQECLILRFVCSFDKDREDQMRAARFFVNVCCPHCLVVQALVVNLLELFSVFKVDWNDGCSLYHHNLEFIVFLDDESAKCAFLRQKKIFHFRVVDLDHLARNLVRVIRWCLQYIFEVLKCLLDQSISFVWTTLHGVGFTCPCLSISEDGDL